MKRILLTIPIFVLFSCHPTKSELKSQIEKKNDTIVNLKSVILDKDNYIYELQEKLDKIKDYAIQVQDGIDNYDLDDAQDGVESLEEEAEYE